MHIFEKGDFTWQPVFTATEISKGRERSFEDAKKRARGAAARVRQWPPGLRGVKIDSERGTASEQHDSELGSSV